MPRTHELKTWPAFYERVISNDKNFEVRVDDRSYQTGDMLILKEWNPETELYTSREVSRFVTFVMHGGQFGIEPGYVVLALSQWKQ